MPAAAPAIAAAGAGVGASSFAGSIGLSALGAGLFGAAASAATAYAASSIFGLNDRSSSVGELYGGTRINPGKADEPIPIVYGKIRVGGPLALRQTEPGTKNKQLWIVPVWSEGRIESIEDHWFDTRRYSGMDSDDRDNVDTLQEQLGEDNQLANAKMISNLPDWTSAHRLRGLAYTAIELKYDQNTWATGMPLCSADVKGVLCFDPRTGATQWTDNPALILLNYLTNDRYGRGVPYEKIDEGSFIDAANYCEEQITYQNGKTYKRYRCDIALDTSKTLRQNVLAIASSCRGLPIYSGGVWSFKIDRPEQYHPLRLTDDIMIGDWNTKLGDKSNRPNRVLATYLDKNRKYEPYQVLVKSDAMLEADNNVINEMRLALPGVSSRRRARYIASQELKQARQSKVITGRANLQALRYAVGDVVQIDSQLNGWDGKPFKIYRMDLLGDDTIGIEAREYDPSVYTLDVDDEDDLPETEFNDPFATIIPKDVQLVADDTQLLQASDGTLISRILATWNYDQAQQGSVLFSEVRWKNGNDLAWVFNSQIQSEDDDSAFTYLQPVADGQQYDVQVRSVNLAGAPSRWTEVERILVEGKSGKPRRPIQLRVVGDPDGRKQYRWPDTEKDVDNAGWRIYFGVTNNFEQATELHSGLITDSPYLSAWPPAGIWYFWIVQVDTSGNESDPLGIGPIDLTQFYAGNAIFYEDTVLQNWPGTVLQGQVASRILYPIDVGTWQDWEDAGVTWESAIGWVVSPEPTVQYETDVVDLGANFRDTRPVAYGAGSDGIVFEVNTSTNGNNWSGWTPVDGTTYNLRYFQFRVTATAVTSTFSYVDACVFMLVET